MPEPSEPPAVHQTSSNPDDSSPDCIFCTIAKNFQPIDPRDISNSEWDPDKLAPPSYVIFSTEHIIAFLDIAPLTRGHILVAPRKHRVKMGDFHGSEMAEIGRLLPLLARAVIRSVLPDIPHEEADYNIVQNNGPGAAQVIPHVHFHIVPRPPLNYRPPSPGHDNPPPPNRKDLRPPFPKSPLPGSKPKLTSKYPPSQLPTGVQQSYIQFGRGRRHELDDEDAVELVQVMRANVLEEWTKEFGQAAKDGNVGGVKESGIERFMGGIDEAAWIEGSGGLVSNLQRRARGEGKL